MRDNYLRLAATLCMVVVGLVAVGDALTINTAWRRRRRPAGLEWHQGGLVVSALLLLGVAVVMTVIAAGVMM